MRVLLRYGGIAIAVGVVLSGVHLRLGTFRAAF